MANDRNKIDAVGEELKNLSGQLPVPREDLSEKEKDDLVAAVGLHTIKNIVKAKKELSLKRIPFLFSAIDTQAVVDVLANDMGKAIERAELLKPKK